MKRRSFLTKGLGVAGALIPATSVLAQSKPCPPAVVGASGGTTATSSCLPGVLDAIAQAMPSGTWLELTGTDAPIDASKFLNVGGISGTILPYCNKGQWNPRSRAIEIIGADHGQSGGPFHVRYAAGANAFALGPVRQPGFVGHGFDHYAVNPFTGDLYWKDYAGGPLYRLLNGAAGWSSLGSSFPSGITGNITYGCDWWSGPFADVGAQGAFALWSCYSSNLYLFDPVANRWRASISGPSLSNSYHGQLNYSRIKNVALFGGTDVASNRVFRLNADASWIELAGAPVIWGITRAQVVADPITGNFLVLQRNGFYELNPDGRGTWTLLNGSRAKPSAVNTNNLDGNGTPGVVLVSLFEHGVIAAISASGGTSARMHLYKHA